MYLLILFKSNDLPEKSMSSVATGAVRIKEQRMERHPA